MISHNDTVRLLTFAAVYDQRTIGEEDVDGWRLAAEFGRWTFAAVRRVIVEYYARDAGRPRITPAVVSDRLRGLRNQAAEVFELPRLPDSLPNADYPAWLRGQRDAHTAALLEQWAATGTEPARALPPAPTVVANVEQLVARAPAEHRAALEPARRLGGAAS